MDELHKAPFTRDEVFAAIDRHLAEGAKMTRGDIELWLMSYVGWDGRARNFRYKDSRLGFVYIDVRDYLTQAKSAGRIIYMDRRWQAVVFGDARVNQIAELAVALKSVGRNTHFSRRDVGFGPEQILQEMKHYAERLKPLLAQLDRL